MKWISVKERMPAVSAENLVTLESDGRIEFDVQLEVNSFVQNKGCCTLFIDKVEYWISQEDVIKHLLSLPKSPSENTPSPGSETLGSDNLTPDCIVDFEYSIGEASVRFKGPVKSWVRRSPVGDDWLIYAGYSKRIIERIGSIPEGSFCVGRRNAGDIMVPSKVWLPLLDQRGKDVFARFVRAMSDNLKKG